MTPAELRARARAEVKELGPEPSDPHGQALWAEERRGACVLLAAFAEWDASLCRRAALEVAEWADPMVRGLLLDAAELCSQTVWCAVDGCENEVEPDAGHTFLRFPICREHHEHGRLTYIAGKVREGPSPD